jgi:predicted aspartyl protease
MYKFRSKTGSYIWLATLISISMTACTPTPTSTLTPPQPAPASSPAISPSPVIVRQNEGEIYQQALTKADAANAIGQSASSKDDWFLVVSNLQESVQMLKSISPNSSEYALAAKVLPKYEQQLATARQKVINFVGKLPPQAINSFPLESSPVATVPTVDPNTFAIPIEKKLGGVPVIQVTFNNNNRVLMLLDTGASRTLITRSIAEQLKLASSGNSQAKTANGTATFKTATIDRIKFGNGEAKAVEVAVGQNDLPYGLLGHDVYNGYDITIKENSIEFRKR